MNCSAVLIDEGMFIPPVVMMNLEKSATYVKNPWLKVRICTKNKRTTTITAYLYHISLIVSVCHVYIVVDAL